MNNFFNKYLHISFVKKWEISPKISFILGECKAIIQAISLSPLLPEYKKRLLTVSLVKGSQATTAIEGNTLSEQEVEQVLDKTSKIPPSKQYQEIEVKNILEALKEINHGLVSKRDIQKITPELILDFHQKVGKNLGEHFQAVPGRFRTNSVVVGNYRCPDYEDVPGLVEAMCEWLYKEFHFDNKPDFQDSIIQAIVAHIYVVWIHPFGDGNGRTARLLEFYLLLRTGTPSIAAHILSNFYNETRTKYYFEIQKATQSGSLTFFIEYALEGFRDGLYKILNNIHTNQLEISWKHFIYESFKSGREKMQPKVRTRLRDLMLAFPFASDGLKIQQIKNLNIEVALHYEKLKSDVTLKNDLNKLVEMDLLLHQSETNTYEANFGILLNMLSPRLIRKPK